MQKCGLIEIRDPDYGCNTTLLKICYGPEVEVDVHLKKYCWANFNIYNYTNYSKIICMMLK